MIMSLKQMEIKFKLRIIKIERQHIHVSGWKDYSFKHVFQLPHFITSIACSRLQDFNVCAEIVRKAWGWGEKVTPSPFARSHPSCFSFPLFSQCPYYLRGWHKLDNQEHSRSNSCLPRIINFATAVSLQCSMKI